MSNIHMDRTVELRYEKDREEQRNEHARGLRHSLCVYTARLFGPIGSETSFAPLLV
jgi:hypothetical protein